MKTEDLIELDEMNEHDDDDDDFEYRHTSDYISDLEDLHVLAAVVNK